MAKILIIDDESAFREGLIETLSDLGHQGIGVGNVRDGLLRLDQQSFDAVFIDFRMPQINGIDALKMIQEKVGPRPLPIVMITAFVDSENTIAAMRLGAFDHLTKPVGRRDIENVLTAIFKAYPTGAVSAEENHPAPNPQSLIGQDPKMREVLKVIGRLAAGESSVLILGETGTGKEVVAKAIHTNSARAAGPFIAVNCAAIPENLLESELFGHVKGAFTGASSDRKGSFQLAEGGTLFLDEIGDMTVPLQAKLLRALQEREITPVGSHKTIRIGARFVAATHQNLGTMVIQKTFREDLFYRLNVVQIVIPPLRDRLEDIPLLAQHFLSALGPGKSFSPAALTKIERHPWPGNVRELKNVVERATILSRGPVIDQDEVRLMITEPLETVGKDADLDLPTAVARLEKDLILKALSQSQGNRSEAARALGIQRQLLYTKIKEYRLEV